MYLDHAADQLGEGGRIFVGDLIVEDDLACCLRLVVEDIIITVEDMLPVPHVEGDDTAK